MNLANQQIAGLARQTVSRVRIGLGFRQKSQKDWEVTMACGTSSRANVLNVGEITRIKTMVRLTRVAWLSASLVSLASSTLLAGPKVRVGARVPSQQRVSFDKIDHAPWNQLLQRYVDDNGMVNYKAWHSTATDLNKLDRYLQHLSSAEPGLRSSRAAQLAYWINAYNAVTVRGILREYPTTSIRNHTARLAGYNIWKDLLLAAGEQEYSLDQIEHQILRKMGEPRIHFAIVCASIGCPRLLNEAYVPDRLDQQLERNSKDFFARPQNFRHNVSRRRFELSAILNWFAEDFGDSQAARLKRIAPWLPTRAAQQAASGNTVRVGYLKYDWNLNEA